MSTAGAHPEVYTAQAVASMSPQILAQLLQTKEARNNNLNTYAGLADFAGLTL